MSLIDCPECGHQVSRKAGACPECGSPVKAKLSSGCSKGCAVLFVAMFVILIIGVLLANLLSPERFRSKSRESEESVYRSKSPPSQESVNWVDNYYRDYPIGGGWDLRQVYVDGNKIVVKFRLPDNQAQGIMANGSRQQFKMVGSIACPSKLEAIWSMLSSRQDIEIEAMYGTTVFIDCSCRDWGG